MAIRNAILNQKNLRNLFIFGRSDKVSLVVTNQALLYKRLTISVSLVKLFIFYGKIESIGKAWSART